MEIQHIDGEKTQTNKLSDIDALLMEEGEKLRILHAQYGRQMLLLTETNKDPQAKKNRMLLSFWNISKEENTIEQKSRDIQNLLHNLNIFIQGFTQGKFYITTNKNYES